VLSRALFVSLAIASSTLAVGACSDPEPARERVREVPGAQEDVAPEPAYRVIPVEDPGSIAGRVTWTGERPELPPLEVRTHQETCGRTQTSDALLISQRGGVADAVVSLTDVRAGTALEPAPVELVHAGCRLSPHVLAVGVGAAITFRSEDPVLHNIHGFRRDRSVWDFAQPERGASIRRTADEPGIIRVLCDVHVFSESWVHVFEHPYFAVSDAEGRYRMTRIPPGQYALRVWHEGWRIVGSETGRPRHSSPVILTRTVSVSAEQETALDFELSLQAGEMAGD
jgi:plastocyanin